MQLERVHLKENRKEAGSRYRVRGSPFEALEPFTGLPSWMIQNATQQCFKNAEVSNNNEDRETRESLLSRFLGEEGKF